MNKGNKDNLSFPRELMSGNTDIQPDSIPKLSIELVDEDNNNTKKENVNQYSQIPKITISPERNEQKNKLKPQNYLRLNYIPKVNSSSKYLSPSFGNSSIYNYYSPKITNNSPNIVIKNISADNSPHFQNIKKERKSLSPHSPMSVGSNGFNSNFFPNSNEINFKELFINNNSKNEYFLNKSADKKENSTFKDISFNEKDNFSENANCNKNDFLNLYKNFVGKDEKILLEISGSEDIDKSNIELKKSSSFCEDQEDKNFKEVLNNQTNNSNDKNFNFLLPDSSLNSYSPFLNKENLLCYSPLQSSINYNIKNNEKFGENYPVKEKIINDNISDNITNNATPLNYDQFLNHEKEENLKINSKSVFDTSQTSQDEMFSCPDYNLLYFNNDLSFKSNNKFQKSFPLCQNDFNLSNQRNRLDNSLGDSYSMENYHNNYADDKNTISPQEIQKNYNLEQYYLEESNPDFLNKIPQIYADQNGCRIIQKKLEQNPSLGNLIYDMLEKNLLFLSFSPFGNYLIQDLVTKIDNKRKEKFFNLIEPYFVKLSLSIHGTRVIQKIIEAVKDDEKLVTRITKNLVVHIIEISFDTNSYHIIKKYVSEIGYPMNKPLYNEIVKKFFIISRDKYGCCMLQKCVECGNMDQKKILISLSLKYATLLITSQYGNYILQYIVKLGIYDYNLKIIQLALTDLQKYCCQKFSSNVIEKILDYSSPDLSSLIIKEIEKNDKLVSEMLVDLYGNYIIQKVLLISKGETYHNLLKMVAKNKDNLQKVSFGNRVLSKMIAHHKELPYYMSMASQGNIAIIPNTTNNISIINNNISHIYQLRNNPNLSHIQQSPQANQILLGKNFQKSNDNQTNPQINICLRPNKNKSSASNNIPNTKYQNRTNKII